MSGPSHNITGAPKPVTGTRFTDWILPGHEGRHELSLRKHELWEAEATSMVNRVTSRSFPPVARSSIPAEKVIEILRYAPTRVGYIPEGVKGLNHLGHKYERHPSSFELTTSLQV